MRLRRGTEREWLEGLLRCDHTRGSEGHHIMSGIQGLELPPSFQAYGLCTPQKPFQPSTM